MNLTVFDNIVSFFTNISFNINSIIIILFILSIILLVMKEVILKKLPLCGIIVLFVLFITTLFLLEFGSLFKTIFLILYILFTLYLCFELVIKVSIQLISRNKIKDYLKNSEFEYFITINKNNRVIDSSQNVLELTNHNVYTQKKLRFPHFLFDHMNIIEFDGQKVTVDEIKYISSQIKEASSKYKTYSFNFVCLNESNSKISYDAVIEPVYFGTKLISKNIYISVDKEDLIKESRLALIKTTTQIEDQRKQLFVSMSLTSGVIMYYDFTSKKYISTQSFLNFTNSTQTEYDFNQFLKMIHPEDVEFFIDQSQTINTLNSTRLKYRLLISDKYYNVFEDSLYLENQDKLVSIVRICSTLDEGLEKQSVLSKDETIGLMEQLNGSNISDTLNQTMELLKGLKDE